MIMAWLWNSMLLEVRGTYMFLTTAKEIWEVVWQSYSKVKDVALFFEIKIKISATKQGNLSAIEYYTTLKNLWLELDYYHNIKMMCSEDVVMLQKFVERKKIFEFLAGFNVEFDPVYVQILGKEEVSSLSEVFLLIQAKGRSVIMLYSCY